MVMETINNQIKLEQEQLFGDFDFMYLDEYLQRSLQLPMSPMIPSVDTDFWTSIIPNNDVLTDFPPSLLLNTQQNFIDNETITHKIGNYYDFGEAEFSLWSECPLLCDDIAWEPISQIPCTFHNNPNPNPNPNPVLVDQNDPYFLLNDTNIEDYYFNDQALTMVNGMEEQNNNVSCENYVIRERTNNDDNNNNKVPKSETIPYEEIRKCFEMPISRAAKELNVGLTVLKKRCRELNIKRWPHRKLKSLDSLISNVKELGMTEVVQFLEEHKRKVHYVPGLELTEETKKLRQTCFKINYKKRRAHALGLAQ